MRQRVAVSSHTTGAERARQIPKQTRTGAKELTSYLEGKGVGSHEHPMALKFRRRHDLSTNG